jgi:small subunit ribosomal protein S6e
MPIKIVINDAKTGKSYKKELNDSESRSFFGKKIGEKLQGGEFGFSGYEFEIRGGNDNSGFPMRRDMEGTKRRKALLTSGPGVIIERKGMKKRKRVAGNTISNETSNVNLKILSAGSKSVESILGIEPKQEEKKEKKEKSKAEKENA